jgi:hypothetical protein
MKNFWLTLGVVLAAGAAAFGAFYTLNDKPDVRRAAREGDAMAWLRAEFHLDAAEFAAIRKLHDDYGRVCADHCRAILAAKRRHAAADEVAALEDKCVVSMTDHFRRVAALMPTGEGARYLAIVLPRIEDYDHHGPPNVQVQP